MKAYRPAFAAKVVKDTVEEEVAFQAEYRVWLEALPASKVTSTARVASLGSVGRDEHNERSHRRQTWSIL